MFHSTGLIPGARVVIATTGNLREHRTLLLKAPIRLRAENRWLMPQELKVACSLLRESCEISLLEPMQAVEEVSGKAPGSGWNSREHCPCTLPAGAHLQAAYPKLRGCGSMAARNSSEDSETHFHLTGNWPCTEACH